MNVQDSSTRPAGSRERTLDEVKAEFLRRAGRLNPFEEIKRDDAERVMGALKSLDKDHWAQEWSKVGLGYEEKADTQVKAGASGAEVAELYMLGLRRLPGRTISVADVTGQAPSLSALVADVSQGGEVFRACAGNCRIAVRRQETHRLSATPARRGKAAGGVALGRRRRLEGRPAAHRQVRIARGPRFAHHRHAGQRREPGFVPRPGGRTNLSHLARSPAAAHRR